jgi:hypothetical protein
MLQCKMVLAFWNIKVSPRAPSCACCVSLGHQVRYLRRAVLHDVRRSLPPFRHIGSDPIASIGAVIRRDAMCLISDKAQRNKWGQRFGWYRMFG